MKPAYARKTTAQDEILRAQSLQPLQKNLGIATVCTSRKGPSPALHPGFAVAVLFPIPLRYRSQTAHYKFALLKIIGKLMAELK